MNKFTTIENITRKEPYRSILLLFHKYPKLEQKHLRYVLCGKEDKAGIYSTYKIQKYLGSDLETYIAERKIAKESITTRHNLNKFLKTLLVLDVIEHKRKGKHGWYFLKKSIKKELDRIDNIYAITCTESNHFTVIKGEGDQKHFFYGFPEEYLPKYSSKEVLSIKESITNIEKELDNIEQIKYKLTTEDLLSRIEKETSKISHSFYDLFIKPKRWEFLSILDRVYNYYFDCDVAVIVDFFGLMLKDLPKDFIESFNQDSTCAFEFLIKSIIKIMNENEGKNATEEEIEDYFSFCKQQAKIIRACLETQLTYSCLGERWFNF